MNRLSIVIPVYYNELNLFPLYDAILPILNNKRYESELIFVDDGSKDNSYNILKELSKRDKRIRVIKLSRNFGAHTAILAGLSYATGDCATIIMADLQDPPKIILDMYDEWSEGSKVVLAVRQDRQDGFIQKTISNTYYKLMRKFALKEMPEGGFDCFLIDRQVVEILKKLEEKNTTLMGQVLWCGFNPKKIYYVRQERKEGESKWTLSKKIKLFVDSFMAFSYFPIRFISTVGFSVASIGFFAGIVVIANKLIYGSTVQGWTSLMCVILLLFGINMIMLGVLGEYLWRNFDETRKRPVFIIDEKVGFENEAMNEESNKRVI